MWSSHELRGVLSHRAVAAGRGQVPGAAVGPLLLLQPRQLRRSLSGEFPSSSHPFCIPLQLTWGSSVQTFTWARTIIAAESLAVSGPRNMMDGSGLGFKELAHSSSISI